VAVREDPLTTSERRLFARGSFLESSRVADILRTESIGGALVMVAALIAFVWANSPWSSSYDALGDVRVGPASLHLDLTLATWAADGLLAIFFFVAGLELKREFVAGDLRDPRRAALPVTAALGGMVAPALVFVAVNLSTGDISGWAVPTATDIAFAVAVLAVISTHLPSGLRTFLLTLAVVDDLLAITVIAVFYTDDLRLSYLLLALVPVGLFGVLVQRRISNPLLLVPLALVAWALVHESGVHATVAGVLLGFTVPVLNRHQPDAKGLAEHLEHLVRPISAGIAVPVFAFFAAGVNVGGWSGLGDALGDRVAIGVIAGLVLGKPIGITAATWLVHTFTRADLDDELAWTDVVGMAMLAGIGFTVSLLIGELAYPPGSPAAEHVKVGVIIGSLVAAVVAGLVLRQRNRVYRRLCALETQEDDLSSDR
jgi:NhaA family Na+:H+ antiporter